MGTAASRDTFQVQDVPSNRSSTKSKISNTSVGSRRIFPRKSSFDLAQDVQTGTAGVEAFLSGVQPRKPRKPREVSTSQSRTESLRPPPSPNSNVIVKATRSPESERLIAVASDVINKTKPREASKRLRVEYEADGTTRITRIPKKNQQKQHQKQQQQQQQQRHEQQQQQQQQQQHEHEQQNKQQLPPQQRKHQHHHQLQPQPQQQPHTQKRNQKLEKYTQQAITHAAQPVTYQNLQQHTPHHATHNTTQPHPPPPLLLLPAIDPPESSSSDESLNRTLLGDIDKVVKATRVTSKEHDPISIDFDTSSTSVISRMVEVRPNGASSTSPQYLPYLITPTTSEGSIAKTDIDNNNHHTYNNNNTNNNNNNNGNNSSTNNNNTTNNSTSSNNTNGVSRSNNVGRANSNSASDDDDDDGDVFSRSSSLTLSHHSQPPSHSHPYSHTRSRSHFPPQSRSLSRSLSLLLSQSQSQPHTQSHTPDTGVERSSSLVSLLLHTASHADPATTLLSIIEDIGGSNELQTQTPTHAQTTTQAQTHSRIQTPTQAQAQPQPPWKRQIEALARLETLLGVNAPAVALDTHATVLATLCEIRNARASVVVAATQALTTMVQKLGSRMDEHADEIVNTLLLKASASASSSLIVNAVAKAVDALAANVSPDQGLRTFCKVLHRRMSTTSKMLAAAALTTVVDKNEALSDAENKQLFLIASGLVQNSSSEISECGSRILKAMKSKPGRLNESSITVEHLMGTPTNDFYGTKPTSNTRRTYAREETYLSPSHYDSSAIHGKYVHVRASDGDSTSDGLRTSDGLPSEPSYTLNQTWSKDVEPSLSATRLRQYLPPPQDLTKSPNPATKNTLQSRGNYRNLSPRNQFDTTHRGSATNLNSLAAIVKLCASTDWRQREKGILKLDNILDDTEKVEKMDVVVLFKKILVPRCVELNVKVALNALCLAVKVIPIFHQEFDTAMIKFLVIELSKCFSSTNSKILEATSTVYDHIIVYCDSSKMLKPWVITLNPERHSKVASAMIVKLRKLVALTYNHCPQEHRRIVVPCVCRLWVSTKLKHETKLLLRVLLGVMGDDLIQAAKELPLATQSALRDFVEREQSE